MNRPITRLALAFITSLICTQAFAAPPLCNPQTAEITALQLAAASYDLINGRVSDGQAPSPAVLQLLPFAEDLAASAERVAEIKQVSVGVPVFQVCQGMRGLDNIETRPAMRRLMAEHTTVQRTFGSNPDLRRRFLAVSNANLALYNSLNPQSSCLGMEGTYAGRCISANGVVPIAIVVTAVPNGYCTMSPFLFFRGANIGVSAGHGTASLLPNPGAAVTGTVLNIYGAGNFTLTGFAGPTYFSCSR